MLTKIYVYQYFLVLLLFLIYIFHNSDDDDDDDDNNNNKSVHMNPDNEKCRMLNIFSGSQTIGSVPLSIETMVAFRFVSMC